MDVVAGPLPYPSLSEVRCQTKATWRLAKVHKKRLDLLRMSTMIHEGQHGLGECWIASCKGALSMLVWYGGSREAVWVKVEVVRLQSFSGSTNYPLQLITVT